MLFTYANYVTLLLSGPLLSAIYPFKLETGSLPYRSLGVQISETFSACRWNFRPFVRYCSFAAVSSAGINCSTSGGVVAVDSTGWRFVLDLAETVHVVIQQHLGCSIDVGESCRPAKRRSAPLDYKPPSFCDGPRRFGVQSRVGEGKLVASLWRRGSIRAYCRSLGYCWVCICIDSHILNPKSQHRGASSIPVSRSYSLQWMPLERVGST